jgi:hypothetical protein
VAFGFESIFIWIIKISSADSHWKIFTLSVTSYVLRDSLWIRGILYFYHPKREMRCNLMVSVSWRTLNAQASIHSFSHYRSFAYSLICSFGHSPTHSLNLLILTSLIISFQRCSTPPTIFVTASHQFPKRPRDAMTVWVEELRVDNFKICLREAKIFDGPHKNIKIVSKFDFRFLSVVILIN